MHAHSNNLHFRQFSRFEIVLAGNTTIAPSAIFYNYKESSSQHTAVENVEPPRGAGTASASTPLPRFPRSSRHSSASPSRHEPSVPPQETGLSTDADTPARADAAGPSRRRNVEVDANDAKGGAPHRDFGDPDLPPEVQQAMKKLVRKIQRSAFFAANALEPPLGTLDANALMAVAPPELWSGYGTKGRSVYSLFVKVDGEDYTCLWCGDVQRGKLQRAIGHFRTRHLGHKPFLCGSIHADNKVW